MAPAEDENPSQDVDIEALVLKSYRTIWGRAGGLKMGTRVKIGTYQIKTFESEGEVNRFLRENSATVEPVNISAHSWSDVSGGSDAAYHLGSPAMHIGTTIGKEYVLLYRVK